MPMFVMHIVTVPWRVSDAPLTAERLRLQLPPSLHLALPSYPRFETPEQSGGRFPVDSEGNSITSQPPRTSAAWA